VRTGRVLLTRVEEYMERYANQLQFGTKD
jgi:hypothetical protein